MNVRNTLWELSLIAIALAACTPIGSPGTDASVLTPMAPTAVEVREAPAASMTPRQTTVAETALNKADVLFVRAMQAGDGTWTFAVTVQHPDTGWENYADGWDVLTEDGDVLLPNPDEPFTRTLLHPHVEEQPFTRSQSGIEIPPGMQQVRVRAHSSVGGYGGREVMVDLTRPVGSDYEVVVAE